jgi:hypothetical protein
LRRRLKSESVGLVAECPVALVEEQQRLLSGHHYEILMTGVAEIEE